MRTYPAEGVSFLIGQEDGDQAYYQRTEEHWDWPEGSSGPTIGVGYDCGYVTKDECTADWKGIVDDTTLANILRGVGLTGTRAHVFVMQSRLDVTITWAMAVQEFITREIPKWDTRCARALPNWDLLGGLSASALLSLTYNRGEGGYQSTLPRFKEMREIHLYMLRGQWNFIPAAIAAQARLWPNVADLRRRRALEAQLFAKGLSECSPLTPPTSSLVASSSPPPASATAPSSST